MGKIEDSIKEIQEEISELKSQLERINFQLIRAISQTQQKQAGEGINISDVNIDLGPIEDRLSKIEDHMASKADLERIEQKINELEDERWKSAQQTIQRVTQLFERGIELIKLENTLEDVKSLLEETVFKEE